MYRQVSKKGYIKIILYQHINKIRIYVNKYISFKLTRIIYLWYGLGRCSIMYDCRYHRISTLILDMYRNLDREKL